MQAASGRYDCVLDPSDLYVIWDNLADTPCMAGDSILALATETAALETLRLLNRPCTETSQDRTGRAIAAATMGRASP